MCADRLAGGKRGCVTSLSIGSYFGRGEKGGERYGSLNEHSYSHMEHSHVGGLKQTRGTSGVRPNH